MSLPCIPASGFVFVWLQGAYFMTLSRSSYSPCLFVILSTRKNWSGLSLLMLQALISVQFKILTSVSGAYLHACAHTWVFLLKKCELQHFLSISASEICSGFFVVCWFP